MLKMVDGTGIIGVDMVCHLGGAVSPPQPPNYDRVEMEGAGRLMLPNSLKAPLERVELTGNSVQGENPAPENPQEIKSAGRKSKNLFNKNTAKQGYEFGSAATDTETINQRWFVSDFMPVKEGVQYYISGKTTGAGCKMYNKDKVFVKNMQASFGNIKFDEGIAYFRINGEIKDLDKIQIEEGIVATDYKPYGYLFDVKVTGKNLFDQSKLISGFINMTTGAFEESANTSFANSLILDKPILLKSGQTLVTSVDNKYAQNFLRYRTYRKDGTFLINNEPLSFSYKATEDLYVIALFYNGMSEEDKKSLQIEISDEPTTYEPYTEQSVQIALNEPLRGIGDYKDTITKDGVVRRVLEVPVVECLSPIINGNAGNRYTFAETPNANINYKRGRCISNIGFTNNAEKKKYVPHPYQENFLIRIADDDTIDMVKEKMKDVIVAYTTKEPVTEPLPESVQAQLSSLHSENGVTHIFVDSGEVLCGIKLTYRKEK